MFCRNPKSKNGSQRCVIGNNTIDHGKSVCHWAVEGKEGREEEKQHSLLGENVVFSNISGAQSVTLLPSGMCFPPAPVRRGRNQSGLIVRLIFTVSFNRYRAHMCVPSIWISCQGGRQKHRHPSVRRNYIFFFLYARTAYLNVSPLFQKCYFKKKQKKKQKLKECQQCSASPTRFSFVINKCILVPSHISLQPNTALQIAS